MQPNTLKKLLGHEDIQTTLNTYCDVFERLQSDNVNQYQSYMADLGITLSGKNGEKSSAIKTA